MATELVLLGTAAWHRRRRAGTDDRAAHDVTEVGGLAERAGVRELILSDYLPADPAAITEAEWARRAGHGFSGTTTAGRDGLRRTLSRAGL